jgi:heterotetrameric sarcosine oxidase alpha subunit
MTGGYRLRGGIIDRARTLRFSFDGAIMNGFAGDTLASALIANGTSLVGRSFKYHRPRGIVSAGPEEPNALVELRRGARREPNSKATTIELYDGLAAQSQNRWPSLRFDLRAIHQLAAPLLVAGFYYKTFMWPAALWEKLYEPAIRRSAGLGRLSGEPDPDLYEKACAFCDLLVVGGGPAGLSAALAAGRAGARVILVDEDFMLGGRLLSETLQVDGMPGAAWARQTDIELAALPKVRILRRTSVFGVYDGEYGAIERVADHLPEPAPFTPRQRLWKIVARESLLASGAIERPIVFGGNDRPGVMLASAVRSYVNRFAASPGRRVVVFTGSDDGWRTAADLVRAGVRVEAVIDPRQDVAAGVRALANDVTIHLGARVIDAHGGQALWAVTFIDADCARKTLRADVLAVSGGWNPNIALATHLGGRAEWSPRLATFLAGDPPKTMSIAGAAAGNLTLTGALREGARFGAAAAARSGFDHGQQQTFRASDEAFAANPIWHVAGSRKTAFVDLQNDVTDKDIAVSVSEGFRSVEHLKRYTTLGMATDQGKTSNLNGLAIMVELTGETIAQAGTTRARPPQIPVAIGAFAGLNSGKHFKPTRLSPAHDWATGQGASFTNAGHWLRAQWFARPGETDWLQSVVREVMAARTTVAICDVSTLGKIALSGPDVGAFLDRIYINTFSTLAVGKVRYGVMLREDGFVMDDGTTARLAPDEYLLSTTTANAAKVMEHLEFCHQVLWPEFDVQMVSVTEQWAQFAVTGPRSRSLLQKLFGAAADLSDPAFPYMACGVFPLGGISARLFRISFSGERAYEIAVPAGYGEALAHELMAAGEDLGVMPYGTEALSVMRIEKGHVAGNELNGQTVARDLGLGRMMSTRKDFVGRIMAERPAMVDPGRPTLVGLRPLDPGARLRSGAHLLTPGQTPGPDSDEGYVTSTAFSPLLGHWIGLGLLARGPERLGEQIRVYDPIRSGDSAAEIVSPIFLDPEGMKLRG